MIQTNIFLSYCWQDEKIADDIYNYFKNSHGIELHKDKIKIDIWESIKKYMHSINNMDYIVLLISDDYLKSSNCMYEVLEVMRNSKYQDKIFPVVINKDIYRPKTRIGYVKFWKKEYEELDEELKDLSPDEIGSLGKDLKRVLNIKTNIADFLDVIADMNNPEIENVNISIENKLAEKSLIKKKTPIDISKFIDKYDYYLTVGDEEVKRLIKEISNTYSGYVRDYFESVYKKKASYFNINSKNKEFWLNILDTEDKVVRDGFVEFLYNHSDLFTDVWYREFPELFKMIVDKHKIFIQKELAPVLEKNYYIDKEVFWRLLYDILEYDSQLIDLFKITNQYNKLMMINEYNFNKNEIAVFNKYKVFKQFINNAGKEYFYNDSSAQWDYYSYGNNYNDDYPEMCFKLIEWDLELIEKLDEAYSYLEDNIKSRSNTESICNGNSRRNSYDKVIRNNSNKILFVIKNSNQDISEFKYIEHSMKKQNII